jgi:hypothetical protein
MEATKHREKLQASYSEYREFVRYLVRRERPCKQPGSIMSSSFYSYCLCS